MAAKWRGRAMWLMLALALALTAVFAFRAVRRAPGRKPNEPVRAWMNVPHVAHSHGIPPHVLYEALNIPFTKPLDRRTLSAIAAAQHRSTGAVIKDVENVIKTSRPPYPPPLTPPIELPQPTEKRR